MRIAYFDCFSGISGDMVLGALLDAGVELGVLEKELKKLPLKNYQIRTERLQKGGIWATKVHIRTEEKGIVRTWANISSLIKKSKLSATQKKKCIEIFLKIASAEAKIHRREIDQVHFHEVGAIDSILDVAGAVIGLALLKIEEVYASSLATGMGLKKIEHGTIPIPAPATLEILKDVPIYSRGITAELVTPTGAAIIKTFAKSFGEMPPLKPVSVGYGAGTQDLEIPNVLRIIIGESLSQDEYDEKSVIETNIDDLNPEFSSYIMEKLFDVGALDVWLTPIYMKKSRLGLKLSVIAPKEKEEQITQVLFKETNTLGARISRELRRIVARKEIRVKTKFGEARAKIGFIEEKPATISPEYDDCAILAKNAGVPIKLIYEAVRKAAEKGLRLGTRDVNGLR
jgi:uncharacterized protein (TIGR00299 family) protein